MTEKIPTMADVIARSYLMHPTLFAEALEKDAKMRRDWVHGLPFDGRAKETAHGIAALQHHIAASHQRMAEDIRAGRRFDPETLEPGAPTI